MRSPSKESLLASDCCRPALPPAPASWWLLPCASQQARRCPTQPDFHWLPFSSQQLRIPSDSQGSTSTLGLLACVYTACHGGFCPVARRPPVSNNTAVVKTYFFFISQNRVAVPDFLRSSRQLGRQQVMVVHPSGSAQLHVCRPRPTHRDTQPITCQSTNTSIHKKILFDYLNLNHCVNQVVTSINCMYI